MFFTSENRGVQRSNERVWFRKWVVERQTFRYLSSESNLSQSTLQRRFKDYLSNAPMFQIRQNKKAYLLIDGTYFTNDLCLVLYYDSIIKYTQLYRFSDKEKHSEIEEDLRNILRLGIVIEAVTCDGHPSILKAIRAVDGNITIQRCLVHIHRESNIWLRKKPVNQQSIALKTIVNMLFRIKNHNDKIVWVETFLDWYSENLDHISEKVVNEESGRWWYKHRNLRRTAVMIKKAIPNMFCFLDDPNISISTNGLESFFGHLKDNLSIHRGLSHQHRKAFIQWYLHFKNQTRK